MIVARIPETLCASQVSLCRLDGDVTQQKLTAPARLLPDGTAVHSPSQVVRCDRWQAAAFRVSLHDCPDHLGRKALSPDSAALLMDRSNGPALMPAPMVQLSTVLFTHSGTGVVRM